MADTKPPVPSLVDCLGEDGWERLACGELSTDERRQVFDHVVDCADCGRIFRALRELESAARELEPSIPLPSWRAPRRARSRSAARTWWPLAAAACVLLALSPLLLGPGADQPSTTFDPVREQAADERPVANAPAGVLEKTPLAFRWEGRRDARAYVIEVIDRNGELIWESGQTEETELPWPDELVVSGQVFWRVVALSSSGGRVPSTLVSFELSASPR